MSEEQMSTPAAPIPEAVASQVFAPATAPQMPRTVRTWLIVLSVIVSVQLLLTVGSIVAAMCVGWGSYGLFGAGMDDSYTSTEAVATQLELLLQDGDVDGYMDLYRADDASVELDEVRADFEKTVESLESTSTTLDYSIEQATLYEDEESGEQVAHMVFAGYDWETGGSVGRRMSIWVLYDELPDVVLTGKEGRELDSGEMLW